MKKGKYFLDICMVGLIMGLVACSSSEETTNNANNGNNTNLGGIVGTLSLDYATDVVVASQYAFVACKSRGVAVVDISNVQSPTWNHACTPRCMTQTRTLRPSVRRERLASHRARSLRRKRTARCRRRKIRRMHPE